MNGSQIPREQVPLAGFQTNLVEINQGQVIFLEAEPGECRRDRLQQGLQPLQEQGVRTWLLWCDRQQDGPWAGLNGWFRELIPQIQANASDLLIQHDYELANLLPILQRTSSVRNPTLTDVTDPGEWVRNYPVDRADRIVQGLIDLLIVWRQQSADRSPWVVVCDGYDQAGALVQRFFTELMRRAGQSLQLTLVVATAPDASPPIAHAFAAINQGPTVRWQLPIDPPVAIDPENARWLAQILMKQVETDPIELEMHVPRLIRYWLLSDQPEQALIYQIWACSIYTARGLYEDALVYGEAALAQLKRVCPEDMQQRWTISVNLYNCYIGLGRSEAALQTIETVMIQTRDPDQLFRAYDRLAMLHARYLPDRDLPKAEAYLQRGLEELAHTHLPESLKTFHAALNRTELALIRHHQGRSPEALQFCRSCDETLNTHLAANQDRLHRSVLLYNLAQVYTVLDRQPEAIAYLSSAMALDPNYSEYYNDRGNLYLRMGELTAAISDYQRAIELSPPDWEVWFNLGRCYSQMGQIREAIAAYSRTIDLNPALVSVWVARANTYEQMGQVEAALADYDAALRLDPDQPLLLANRAILHYQVEHLPAALTDLDQAIALAPANPDLYQNRAVVWLGLDRIDQATADLQTYLQLQPDAVDRAEVEGQLLRLQS